MAIYYFEVQGVTSANEGAFLAAIGDVSGCTITPKTSLRGAYIISVTTDLSEDDAFAAISAALPPGVRLTKMTKVSTLDVGTAERFIDTPVKKRTGPK
jgi:hypothetical protein